MKTSWEPKKAGRLEQRKEKSTEVLKNARWYSTYKELKRGFSSLNNFLLS